MSAGGSTGSGAGGGGVGRVKGFAAGENCGAGGGGVYGGAAGAPKGFAAGDGQAVRAAGGWPGDGSGKNSGDGSSEGSSDGSAGGSGVRPRAARRGSIGAAESWSAVIFAVAGSSPGSVTESYAASGAISVGSSSVALEAADLAAARPLAVRVFGAGSAVSIATAVTPASEVPQMAQNAWPGETGDEHVGHCDDSATRDPPIN
jgi:hypothetical protein